VLCETCEWYTFLIDDEDDVSKDVSMYSEGGEEGMLREC